MYEEHEIFKVGDKNIKLWRYMDLSKFLYLLRGNLFFTRMDNFEVIQSNMYNELH